MSDAYIQFFFLIKIGLINFEDTTKMYDSFN